MKSDYNEKRKARKESYEKLSEKNTKLSQQLWDEVNEMSNMMNGQPILVEHHSEGRHRRDIAKMHNKMSKSVEADKKADYYRNRLETLERDYAISSDDPEAISKLKSKILSLEKNQELMKEANKVIKSKITDGKKIEWLISIGLSQNNAEKLISPNHFGGPGYARFSLTNNNANIRRNKERLIFLQNQAASPTQQIQIGSVRIVDNAEDNRVQIFFPDKPSEQVRTELKRNGFRWSPKVGAWMRHRSNEARSLAKEISSKILNKQNQ